MDSIRALKVTSVSVMLPNQLIELCLLLSVCAKNLHESYLYVLSL